MFTYLQAAAYLISRGYTETTNPYGGDFVKGEFEIQVMDLHLTGLHARFADKEADRSTMRLCSSEADLAKFANDVETWDMQKYFDFDYAEFDDMSSDDEYGGCCESTGAADRD